jgi:hypothetical protein
MDWEQFFFHSSGEVLAEILKPINYLKLFHWRSIQSNRCKIKFNSISGPVSFVVGNLYPGRMVSACVAECFLYKL